MASILQIPKTLTLSQLKILSFKCGLATTGTKPVLLSRLHHEITNVPLKSQNPTRVLSIDMGIRNLAYCILSQPATSPSSKKKRLPTLHSWHRLAVSSAPSKASNVDNDTTETSPADAVEAKESFDPATLSTAAYTLLRTRLLTQSPTHVLIERQRFRSFGSKQILEWTVRVNMLESILYATLHTLKAEGIWNGVVIPVNPGKVGPFWVGEEGEQDLNGGKGEVESNQTKRRTKIRVTKSSKAKNKGAKVDLVRGWLDDHNMVLLGSEQVVNMAEAYKDKWDGARGSKNKLIEGEKMGKLDDLADCLLQGMAWFQWEENKRLALMQGVERLLDPYLMR